MHERGLLTTIFHSPSRAATARGSRRRRPSGGTVRLGNRRRRLRLAYRPGARWRFVMTLFRRVKKAFWEVASNGLLFESCHWSFPFIYPLGFAPM
ncbi:hypothetical protein MRB53_027745 [Persea americana]|uniref:Uncharacterized protein n=1 Tax=Persea americana TaxID=3435 RepID=A0ACC2LMY7_PERAE|nr:hypothetical protein MRB53_027745 [Persea americana]